MGGSYYRDNLGFNTRSNWNTDIVNINMGGPIPFLGKKNETTGKRSNRVSFFISGDMSTSDTYFNRVAERDRANAPDSVTFAQINAVADQLHSSLFTKNDSMWAPRQDNRWANTLKLTWNIRPGMKLALSNQHSLNINQNSRSLQIIGNDAIMRPGFAYPYSLNLDNANTYTHHSNLTILNFKTLLDTASSWTLDLTMGRLFTNLRADANGRPFRESTVDRL